MNYLIGSGVYFYRMGETWKAKFRGFNFEGTLVEDILERRLSSDDKAIEFFTKKRFSIQEAARIHNDDIANEILSVGKKLNINFDRKRVWLDSWNSGKELKTKSISSIAIPLLES